MPHPRAPKEFVAGNDGNPVDEAAILPTNSDRVKRAASAFARTFASAAGLFADRGSMIVLRRGAFAWMSEPGVPNPRHDCYFIVPTTHPRLM